MAGLATSIRTPRSTSQYAMPTVWRWIPRTHKKQPVRLPPLTGAQFFVGLCSTRYEALSQFFCLFYAALVMQHSVSFLVVCAALVMQHSVSILVVYAAIVMQHSVSFFYWFMQHSLCSTRSVVWWCKPHSSLQWLLFLVNVGSGCFCPRQFFLLFFLVTCQKIQLEGRLSCTVMRPF